MGTSHSLSVGNNNHAITANPNTAGTSYANIAARDADSDFNTTATNVNKVVRVESPLSFYILTAITPAWLEFTSTSNDEWTELSDTPGSISANFVVQGNSGGTALEFGQNLNTSASPTFTDLTLSGGDLTINGTGTAGTNVIDGNTITLTPQSAGTAFFKMLRSSGADGCLFTLNDTSGNVLMQTFSGGNLLLEVDSILTLSGQPVTLSSTTHFFFNSDLGDTLPYILAQTGLSPFDGEKQFFMGSRDSPEGVITGKPGDQYDKVRVGAASTIFIHRGASDGNTGWFDLSLADVAKVGTPVDNQVGVWTGDGTLEGDSKLTYDGSTSTLEIKSASASGNAIVRLLDSTGADALTIDFNDTSNAVSITSEAAATSFVINASLALSLNAPNSEILFTASTKFGYTSQLGDAAAIFEYQTVSTNGATKQEFLGTRNPEGLVTGNPGDQYHRVNGVNSGIFILKAASAGNTGWVDASLSDVTKVGTPVDNQVGIWTGDGTLEGDTGLTFDGSILTAAAVTVTGDLIVNGTTTTINSTTLTVDDKNIELGSVATPTDVTADGGGITLKGATDKTINWVNATDSWTFSHGIQVDSLFSIGAGSLTIGSTGGTLTLASGGTGKIDLQTGNAIVDVNSSRITEVLDPTLAQDAATKNYVDTNFGAGTVTNTGTLTDNALVRGNGGVDIDVGNIVMSSDGNDLTIPGVLTVGIGTLQSESLHVVGTGTANTGQLMAAFHNSANASRLTFRDEQSAGAVPPLFASVTGNGFGLAAEHANGRILFLTAGIAASNERMRISNTGLVGIGTLSSIDTLFHVQSSAADTTAIVTTESTGSNAGITTKFVGSRDPQGNVTGAGGDEYYRDDGDTSGTYESLELTTGTEWFRRSVLPANVIEINTSAEFEALATAGVITISSTTTIRFNISISTTSVIVMSGGATLHMAGLGQAAVGVTYTGTGTFLSGTGTIRMFVLTMFGTSSGTFLNLIGGTFNIDSISVIGFGTLGTFDAGIFLLRKANFISPSTGFTVTNANMSLIEIVHVGVPLAGALFTINTNNPASVLNSTVVVATNTPTGSVFDFNPRINNTLSLSLFRTRSIGGTVFKQSALTDATIDSVADGSISAGTLTAQADNSSGGTTHSSTTTYFEDEEVVITGTTSYNGTFQIFNVVAGVSFDTITTFVADDATGSVATVRLALTLATGHGISIGDSLKLTATNFYNGFAVALNVVSDVITINGTFISTNIGTIKREFGLDATDPRINSQATFAESDSHNIACAHVNGNSTANGAITNNDFTDMLFGTVGSALVASSTMQRNKLVNELNGTFENIGNEPFDGLITFDFTVKSGGGTIDFRFKWQKFSSTTITATTIAFVDSNPDTITDSGNGFLTAGFAVGDSIDVAGSTSNDGSYTITAVVAGTITLSATATDPLTTESAGAAVTIIGFSDLEDPVESLVNVGADAQSVTKTFPLAWNLGNKIKPQITRDSGSTGITTSYATIYATNR